MRILLQNQDTKRYLTPSGAWSENAEAAVEFSDLAQARAYGTSCGFSRLSVVALTGRASKSRRSALGAQGPAPAR